MERYGRLRVLKLKFKMVSLPLVIILSAVMLPILLEERFKFITTLLFMGLGVVLSFISQPIVKSVTADTSSWENNALIVSLFIYLIISAFIFSNNIVHKIFIVLLLYLNYVFISDAVISLMTLSIMPQGGLIPGFTANGLFVLFSVVIAILLVNPMKYFYRREVSYSAVIMCLLVLFGVSLSGGMLCEIIKIDSVNLKVFPTFFIYVMIIFAARSMYSAAKYRVKDSEQIHESEMDIMYADNFDVMLACAENLEAGRVRREKELLGIRKLLETEEKEKVYEYVTILLKKLKKQKSKFAYCNNPYISTIIAAKADVASADKIFIDGNIEINDVNIEINELCMIVDELLTALINDCRSDKEGEKYIRLNGMDSEGKLVLEAVSSYNDVKKVKLLKNTIYDFGRSLCEKKENRVDPFARIKKYVSEHSGNMNISVAEGEKITRIELNFK